MALSENWTTTEYNNQSDVANFWTIAEVATGFNNSLYAFGGM